MRPRLCVCAEGTAELKRHLAFREWLRAHPDDAGEYGRVKREGAALYPRDVDACILHKEPFILRTYRLCGL